MAAAVFAAHAVVGVGAAAGERARPRPCSERQSTAAAALVAACEGPCVGCSGAVLPLTLFEMQLDRCPVHAQWFSLEPFGRLARPPEAVFACRVQLRACHEGTYHGPIWFCSTSYCSKL